MDGTELSCKVIHGLWNNCKPNVSLQNVQHKVDELLLESYALFMNLSLLIGYRWTLIAYKLMFASEIEVHEAIKMQFMTLHSLKLSLDFRKYSKNRSFQDLIVHQNSFFSINFWITADQRWMFLKPQSGFFFNFNAEPIKILFYCRKVIRIC